MIKIIIIYFCIKKMNSYNLIYKSISIYFHLRKVPNDLKKLIITLFVKKNKIIKKTFYSFIYKILKFNQISLIIKKLLRGK